MIIFDFRTTIRMLFAICLLSSASLRAITVQGTLEYSEESTA